MQILNFIKSLYFNFRYLPFRQAVYMPVWITTNFRIHGLKRGQLILHQPYRKSVFLGDCGSPGLQEMKGGLYFTHNTKLILHGFTVISQGSVLRMDEGAFIDTARMYGNEEAVGLGIRKSGIPRERLFITTKLMDSGSVRGSLRDIDDSLRKLGTDYVDLLLLHEPYAGKYEIYRP